MGEVVYDAADVSWPPLDPAHMITLGVYDESGRLIWSLTRERWRRKLRPRTGRVVIRPPRR